MKKVLLWLEQLLVTNAIGNNCDHNLRECIGKYVKAVPSTIQSRWPGQFLLDTFKGFYVLCYLIPYYFLKIYEDGEIIMIVQPLCKVAIRNFCFVSPPLKQVVAKNVWLQY